MGEKNTQDSFGSSGISPSDKLSYCNGFFVKIGLFMSRIETPLMVTGVVLGVFWFFLPSIHEGARKMLLEIPFAYAVFDSCTRLEAPVLLFIFAMGACGIFLTQISISRGFPGGWDVRKEGVLPNAKTLVEKKLFPISRLESFIFLLWVVFMVFSAFLSASPFIFIGYFIRIGE